MPRASYDSLNRPPPSINMFIVIIQSPSRLTSPHRHHLHNRFVLEETRLSTT